MAKNGLPCNDRGGQVEPGHQFEWSWLIGEVARLTGPSGGLEEKGQALFDWAERHGMNRDLGGIFNILDINGEILDDGMRLWPVTEYLKAVATQSSLAPVQRQERLVENLGFLLEHYFQPDGRWHEYLRRDLSPSSDYLPASSLYHILMAYLVLRENLPA